MDIENVNCKYKVSQCTDMEQLCIERPIKIEQEITGLQKLVEELHRVFSCDHVNIQDVQKLMAGYKSNPKDWRKYAKFDRFRYTRNLVDEGNGAFNIMILCWGPGHASAIHDHADSHCFMKLLSGNLDEIRYDWPKTVEPEVLRKIRNKNNPRRRCCSVSEDKLLDKRLKLNLCQNKDCDNFGRDVEDYINVDKNGNRNYSNGNNGQVNGRYEHDDESHSNGSHEKSNEEHFNGNKNGHANENYNDENIHINGKYSNGSEEIKNGYDKNDNDESCHMKRRKSIENNGLKNGSYENGNEVDVNGDKKYGNGANKNCDNYQTNGDRNMNSAKNGNKNDEHDNVDEVPDKNGHEENVSEEFNPESMKEIGRTRLEVNDVCYINDALGLHRMENPSHVDGAVSLHLYCPPFDACRVFDARTGKPTRVPVTFWSTYGKKVKRVYEANKIADSQ